MDEITLNYRISKLTRKSESLEHLSKKISYVRLFVFAGGLGISLLFYIFKFELYAYLCFTIMIASFLIISHFHSKIDRANERFKKWIEIQKAHLSRMNLDWENIPKITLPAEIKIEPIESDINISGDQSLLQLLASLITTDAIMLLRKWLVNNNPGIDEISKRQNLIKELIPNQRFRDRLILNGFSYLKKSSQLPNLNKWTGSTISIKQINLYLFGLTFHAILTLTLFIINLTFGISTYWTMSLLVYLAIYFSGNRIIKDLIDETSRLEKEFGKLSSIFTYLKKAKLNNAPEISKLILPFKIKGENPSDLLEKVSFLSKVIQLRGNGFVWFLLIALFPIDYVIAYRLNSLKKKINLHLGEWISIWHNLEALSSLANFAVLNKGYTFPTFSNNVNEVIFSSHKISHPLIKKEVKIKNDFSISGKGKIALITGSNMSGKSTFLRTVAINQALAKAGSVVDADYFQTSLFRLFTCIKVSDSVTDGISYFYAEVKRLKVLLDELNKREDIPVLFFIDEIFKGTNNKERLIGSKSFINKIVGDNGIGFISTHDLDLVHLEDENRFVTNYHFKEEIRDDRMVFDYLIHRGPCPTTNALKIMELEGLPVNY
jgi:hypothetical protein